MLGTRRRCPRFHGRAFVLCVSLRVSYFRKKVTKVVTTFFRLLLRSLVSDTTMFKRIAKKCGEAQHHTSQIFGGCEAELKTSWLA